ncbi:hypothetical protein PpBr36_09136 [Pyricularia pennisetigena]|uniref:hypothetical protein n=1 Tax=Pyricularia pennisetigena TaxID=1578925 RepID=UPI0011542234|nr:hypothetical protein PpBr36_09136 [Pyricularia pennisetigena]TLS24189.1 hypothetical protein PpBr36_09136 [Pyricularia pennisetigena]
MLPGPGDFYIKRPNLMETGSVNMVSFVSRELEVCETLKRHTHPNVATPGMLNSRFLNKSEFLITKDLAVARQLVAEQYLTGIKAGVRRLHAHGIVRHNMNPANVAITENDVLVVIDFDSSPPPGTALGEIKRTPGWSDRRNTVAQTNNDLKALR